MIPNTASNPKIHRFFRIYSPEICIDAQKPVGANIALFPSNRGEYFNSGGGHLMNIYEQSSVKVLSVSFIWIIYILPPLYI